MVEAITPLGGAAATVSGDTRLMKAVRIHGPAEARLDEVPLPQIGPDDVLVRVRAAGICASSVESSVDQRRIEPQVNTEAGSEQDGSRILARNTRRPPSRVKK